MPPRFAYWTIILDGTPTSFRTKEREDILPLFNQLKAKNPAALLKWFSGGRLWDSPEQAKDVRNVEKVRRFREERSKETKEQRESEDREMAAFREKHGRPADGSDQPRGPGSSFDSSTSSGSPRAAPRGDSPSDAALAQDKSGPGSSDPLAEFRRQHGRPADGSDQRPPAPQAWSPGSEDRGAPRAPRREGRGAGAPDRRGKDWRPGGEHKDPRDKYKLPPGEARKRWKDRNLGPRVPKPFGSKPDFRKDFRSSGPSAPPKSGVRSYGDRPREDRPFGDRPRGPKPFGGKPDFRKDFRNGGASAPRGPKPFGSKPFGSKPGGDRPRGPKPFGSKPGGDRPYGGKPRGPGGGRPFGAKPGGGRPFGGKPRGPGKPPGGPRRKR